MKKVVVYFLLFIFTIQSTKSLWIITSFQINRDYIASNLCINRFDKIPTCKGQCFLNNELSKEQKDNKKNLTTIEKDTIFIAPQFIAIQKPNFYKSISNNTFSTYKAPKYNSFLFSFENPPELV
ncbi:hypothetical protein [Flavobacterium sp.]|jgi:hypothetical protein|uniref:hypothetical protein n=1 Tax=Flavobacterium sp. TaxID=239 RepID=UPI0037C100C4